MAIDPHVHAFHRMVKERSREHQMMMAHAVENALWASAGSLLRQELDSLIRVDYLALQSEERRAEILRSLMTTGVFGMPGRNGRVTRITDREMVSSARSGWIHVVYDFGCKFVHLSEAHDYRDRDPFQALPVDDRQKLVGYLNRYHHRSTGKSASADSTFEDIMGYAPTVLAKITRNIGLRPLPGAQ